MSSRYGSGYNCPSGSSQNDFYSMYNQFVEEQNEKDEAFNNVVEMAHDYANSRVIQHNTNRTPVHGGSKPGREYRNRPRGKKHKELMADCFVDMPLYSDEDFRRRFRMKRPLFLRLLADCERVNPYFKKKLDAIRKAGFSPLQKVTTAMRMLAYAYSTDSIHETFKMGEATANNNMREFCRTILHLYKTDYLCAPNQEDLRRLLDKAERRGFPGMIGSLDCMHWIWKNCPTAWQWSFSGRTKKPTIVLEAVADTWIWHAFLGIPDAQNDLTVLGRSPLFDDLTRGKVPDVSYKVNGNVHTMPYYLADGIYPKWGTLIQSIRQPRTPPEQLFSKLQESYRKDVKRAFGILQAHLAIVNQPGRGWHTEDLSDIMLTCVELHSMIVEDERHEYDDAESEDDDTNLSTSRRARANIYPGPTRDVNPRCGELSIENYMMRHQAIRSVVANRKLRDDLIAHVWERHS